MDYCPGGELSGHLQAADRFAEEVAQFYAAELVLALEHLHRHGIIYRDLKPENILLTAQGHLKLVDFGLSKFGITEATSGASTLCGSYEYLAPEVFQNKGYGSAVDWWSFGAVLYEMLTGLPPWYHENHATMRKNILTQPLRFPSHISEEARDLLQRLLTLDPTNRIGSRDDSLEIRAHPFFRHLDWQMVTFREIFPPIQPCQSDDVIVCSCGRSTSLDRIPSHVCLVVSSHRRTPPTLTWSSRGYRSAASRAVPLDSATTFPVSTLRPRRRL
jgi:serine/threonine protein kinase